LTRRGSGPKPARLLDKVSVSYSPYQRALFNNLRQKALEILEALGTWKASAIVHGSLARGDVDEKSDIDILLPVEVSTQLVEARLEAAGFEALAREIAQATPVHSPKAHIYLDPEQKKAVTIPLAPLRKLELEFYKFGGTVTWQGLRDQVRRPGCTKKLTLIEPTEEGHVESSILGREPEVARLLGVSVDIVRERIRVLTRRDSIGRTGVFLKLPVPEGVSFEEALRAEAKVNPALRRTLRERRSHG
jgi:predicted nucleotidyltransferase